MESGCFKEIWCLFLCLSVAIFSSAYLYLSIQHTVANFAEKTAVRVIEKLGDKIKTDWQQHPAPAETSTSPSALTCHSLNKTALLDLENKIITGRPFNAELLYLLKIQNWKSQKTDSMLEIEPILAIASTGIKTHCKLLQEISKINFSETITNKFSFLTISKQKEDHSRILQLISDGTLDELYAILKSGYKDNPAVKSWLEDFEKSDSAYRLLEKLKDFQAGESANT